MVQSLIIIKNAFDQEDEIHMQPTMIDDGRVLDIMMWLKADKKNQQQEYHHIFDLQEVEMIRDFLTSVLSVYKQKTSFSKQN